MSKSLFTQIRLGEIPGEILYQDDQAFVMMTIAPHNPGHCMVVPVAEVADFEVLPETVYQRVMSIAQQMAKVLKRVYASPKVALAIVGMEVPHTHVHLFPLYRESEMNPETAKHPPMSEITAEANKIRAALKESPIV